MDRPSNIETQTALKLSLLSDDIKHIANQKTNSPRAANARADYNLSIQNLTQSLFRRNADFRGVISDILFQCDLKSILTLRLVSKGFYEVASMINASHSSSALMNKAMISFEHNQVHPSINRWTEDKFNFATKHTEVNITISVEDFFHSSSILNSIPESKLKIFLKITDLKELNQLCSSFFYQPPQKYIDKIKGLSFEFAVSEDNFDDVNMLLTTINKNSNYFPSLTTLSFRYIRSENNALELPITLNNITNLVIEGMYRNNKNALRLLEAFDGLERLSLESISGTVHLANSLCNLKSLFIGKIEGCDVLTGLDSLPNLTSVKLRNSSSLEYLPETLHSVTNLTIDVFQVSTPKLLESFSNLTTLIIDRFNNPNLKLFLPPTLKQLVIKYFLFNSSLILPDSLPNLTSLSLGAISKYFEAKLPNSLHSLTSLTINKKHAILVLPTLMYPYKYFTMEAHKPRTIAESEEYTSTCKLLNEINARINPATSLGSCSLQ